MIIGGGDNKNIVETIKIIKKILREFDHSQLALQLSDLSIKLCLGPNLKCNVVVNPNKVSYGV